MTRLLGSVLCLVVLTMTLSAPVQESKGKVWAVLVSGSYGYQNYRHQASICHAYQILHRHGVPDSQIIVMMYDDIAQNPENPEKGQIFNVPHGPDVYENVPKDYTGEEVTPQNFIHVLTGNRRALKGIGSGKVLKSGPNDHVFVNFVDHGSTGLITFPGAVMYADQLLHTLLTMHKHQMYKQLAFYLDASYSGSMFQNFLPANINVIALTAAKPSQRSYACHWNDTLQTYMADEFGIAWTEDVESEEHFKRLTTDTWLKQYKDIVSRVRKSQPSLYGDVHIKKDHVNFTGDINTQLFSEYIKASLFDQWEDPVSTRDVAMATLKNKILLTYDEWERDILKMKYDRLLKGRKMVDQLIEGILGNVAKQTNSDMKHLVHSRSPLTLDMMPCYRTLVENFNSTCLNINKNTYTLSHLYKLANLCALQDLHVADVLHVYDEECTESYKGLSGVD